MIAGDAAGLMGRVREFDRLIALLDAAVARRGGGAMVAWDLAMGLAGALVCDAGGGLSHSAITARELGIPAVVGCRKPTATLRTGDRVTVEGTAGAVHRG